MATSRRASGGYREFKLGLTCWWREERWSEVKAGKTGVMSGGLAVVGAWEHTELESNLI